MRLTLYLNTPGSSRQEVEPSEKLMVFPAPPPDDSRAHDVENAESDFTGRDRPFSRHVPLEGANFHTNVADVLNVVSPNKSWL